MSLAYLWSAVQKFFLRGGNSWRLELRTYSKMLISPSLQVGLIKQVCLVPCACKAANANICRAYLCTHPWSFLQLGLLVLLCFVCGGRRTGTAASSLHRHRFLFKKPLRHLNSSDLAPLPLFDLRPSWLGSRFVIPAVRTLGFFLFFISISERHSKVYTQLKNPRN